MELGRGAGRFVGRSAVAWLALVCGAAAFALLAAAVSGASEQVVGVDARLAAWLNAFVAPRPGLVAALEAVTALGGGPVLWPVLLCLTAFLLHRRRARLAGYTAVTGLGAVVLTPTTKELVGRLRPVVEVPVSAAGGPSYPSGHAFGSTVVYGTLLLVLWPLLGRRGRVAATAATVVLLLAIGATRLALGVHFLSDVLGGWALGVAWLVITATAFAKWRRDAGAPPAAAFGPGLEPEIAADPGPAPRPPVAPPVRPPRTAPSAALRVLVLAVLVLAVIGARSRRRRRSRAWRSDRAGTPAG